MEVITGSIYILLLARKENSNPFQLKKMQKIIIILIICLFTGSTAFSQNGYIKQELKLPFSNEAKEYYVKRVGTNYILNGDIIVGSTLQSTRIYQSNNSNGAYIWPKGNVPVAIDLSMYKSNMQEIVLRSIDAINNTTSIQIMPYTGQKDYIRIMFSKDTGFAGISPVGRRGGEQLIYITNSGDEKAVVHELLHSLGFWHEQSRYDRDNYISINWSNIDSTFMHNFQIEPGTPSGKYDYESIMHYPAMAFAKNPAIPTIQCKEGKTISNCTFGSAYIFSQKDIMGINATYWFNVNLPKVKYREELLKNEGFGRVNKVQQQKVSDAANVSYQPIGDGIYKIKVNQTGKYLAVEGVNKENGARLVQWDFVDQPNHKFKVRNIGNGFYEISAVHSNRYLNAAGQLKVNGTPVIQYDYASQDNVKWRIYYSKQPGYPGWVLENKGSSPIRLASEISATNNGEPFVLMLPGRVDANEYEPMQTFTFERLENLVMSETGLYEKSPEMRPKMKKNQ